MRYLESSTEQNKDAYQQTEETIQQGKIYYTNAQQNSMAYRENMMVKNFIGELTKVNNADVVGIYGSAHTNIFARDTTETVPYMAQALKALYGDNLLSEDLTPLAKEIEAINTDTIMLAGMSYRAYSYGKQDLQGFKDFSCREF